MKTMQTNAYHSKTNFDNAVMTINPDQPFEISTYYSWSQYVRVNLALATTLIGAMLIKPTIASSPSLLSNDADAVDSVLDNSQQLINPQKALIFTDNSLPIQPRHAKRAFGSEFQINTYTSLDQRYPSVAALTTGGFVVVWQSTGQDGDGHGIYGQRYLSSGIPQGNEFQINTYTSLDQRYPSVAALTTGDFVVVWESSLQDGDWGGIYGQRFSSTGIPQGSEFQINTYTTNMQQYPAVANLSAGGFAVVWVSDWQDGAMDGIYGQRFSSIGTPQGNEFQINTYTSSLQVNPSVASLTTGDFLVVWQSDGQDGNSGGIYGQRFSSTGIPQGSEFQTGATGLPNVIN